MVKYQDVVYEVSRDSSWGYAVSFGCHLLLGFGSGGIVAAGTGEDVETETAAPVDPLVVLLGRHDWSPCVGNGGA